MCACCWRAKKRLAARELRFVASKPAELKADFALVSDTELFAPGLPTLCVGLRGMIYTELEVRGAKTDLHSGMYGGAAPNPFIALAQILARLKDEDGHILIPGFYDDIIPPSPEELAAWRSLPFDEEQYRIEVGARQLVGEAGYSVLERTWARPTLDVHGIPGGFTGAGAKTVIPAKAVAKVSMRLVPGMTPAKAFALYKSYVEKIAPAGVDVEVRLIHSGDPCLIPVDNPYIQAATRRCTRSGARIRSLSAPAARFRSWATLRALGLPSVMMGFGLPDDNIHAPNEKFNLKNFELGIESLIRFLEEARMNLAAK
jgi:acetylornithine deacetylase/succinyl-diaminopimelate desuccinylase-like protein